MGELGIVGIVLAACGSALLVSGVAWAIVSSSRRSGMTLVQGRVVRLVRAMSRGWAPVVSFNGPHGPVEFESPVYTQPARFKEGEIVPVRFDPANPSKAMVDGWLERWLGPTVLCFLGFVMGSIGFVFVLFGVLTPSS